MAVMFASLHMVMCRQFCVPFRRVLKTSDWKSIINLQQETFTKTLLSSLKGRLCLEDFVWRICRLFAIVEYLTNIL